MSSLILSLLLGCESMKQSNNECMDCDTSVLDTGSNDTNDTIDSADTTNDTDDTEVIDTANTNVDADGDGFTLEEGDCDDDNPNANPYASEYCDGFDNNCDGVVDEASALDSTRWYEDSDGDSFGNPDSYGQACDQPDGFVSDNTDCDDTDGNSYPGASEVWYDDIDQDCDPTTEYDADGDGLDDRMVDLSIAPQYIMEVHPIGNSNGKSFKGLPLTLNQDKHGFRKTHLQTPKMY